VRILTAEQKEPFVRVPATIMRGGTSKGVFLRLSDVPTPGRLCDALLLDIMGSPDAMQLDGLGGTHSSTSKVMIVGPGTSSNVDVSYWFAQVGVNRAIVDWSGNCGNLTAAVGPFAIHSGLISATSLSRQLRLRNENTGIDVVATVPTSGDRVEETGEFRIAGLPHPGAPILTDYLEPSGKSGALPTGSERDHIRMSNGQVFEVSVVDVTHPYAFVKAEDLGISGGRQDVAALNANEDLLERLEELRSRCAALLGVVKDWRQARVDAPATPRLVLVDFPLVGHEADESSDIEGIGISMGKFHHALPMTGGLCLGAATRIAGTVPNMVARVPEGTDRLRVGHPKGVTVVVTKVDVIGGHPHIKSVGVIRTARRLMEGYAYVRRATLGRMS
jgi:2-methylaconitate isomerase